MVCVYAMYVCGVCVCYVCVCRVQGEQGNLCVRGGGTKEIDKK